LPAGWTVHTSSLGIHRTPNEQFELYKEGRAFKDGMRVGGDKKKVVTGKDGFNNKSRHNYLPASGVDIVLFDPTGKELKQGPQEDFIEDGANKFNLEWGGKFPGGFQDPPHIQIPLKQLFKSDLELDEALQWQKYLFHGGALKQKEDLDGLWGKISTDALEAVTGSRERNPETWETLFEKFGPSEALRDFDDMNWIPNIKGTP
jgi:hypothetical protein